MSDETTAEAFAYERVLYPSPVLEALTPDRLRASAMLHDLDPPDAETASILEIGCGDGVGLAAWAAVAPRARIVGFDLSATAIARGRTLVEAANLANVELEVGDILTYPLEGERFDYIVCHGVLSWVPEPVRAALIALIAARLAPGGIAYVSYDCLPGAALKAAIVPFLRSLVPPTNDPVAAARAAAGVVDMLNRSISQRSAIRAQIDQLMETLVEHETGYFYHDWLAEHYDPVDLRTFAQATAARGLRIAGSAANYDVNLVALDAEAQRLLHSYGDDHAGRLRALELILGPFTFHRELLVRADAPPPAIADGFRALTYCFEGEREQAQTPEGPATKYFLNKTVFVTTQNPEVRRVLDLLTEVQPAELSYREILARTGLGEPDLRDALFNICRSNFAVPRTMPPPFTFTPGERPVAGRLVRAMARLGPEVVNLRSTKVEIEQDETRLLFMLCDGTRTRAEVAKAMSAELGRQVPLAMVEGAVAHFARRRLFSA